MRPQPPRLFGCGPAARCPPWFVFLRVLRVLCGFPSPCPPYPPPSLQPNLAECTAQRFRSLFSHLRALRGLLFSVSSVSSVVFLLRALRLPLYYQPLKSSPRVKIFMPPRERVAGETAAARLAMPAVTPAEPHNPELCGSSNAIRPHDCALHLNPPRRVGASQRFRPLSSYLRVLRALCGLVFSVSSVASVVCFSLCPPCPLWFSFSGPSLPTALVATEPCRVYGPAFPFRLFPPPCPPWFVFLCVLRVLCGLLFPYPPHPPPSFILLRAPAPNLLPW